MWHEYLCPIKNQIMLEFVKKQISRLPWSVDTISLLDRLTIFWGVTYFLLLVTLVVVRKRPYFARHYLWNAVPLGKWLFRVRIVRGAVQIWLFEENIMYSAVRSKKCCFKIEKIFWNKSTHFRPFESLALKFLYLTVHFVRKTHRIFII